MNSIDRDIRDKKLTDTCHNCCLGCEMYKTVKEMNVKCEARKARGRIIGRMAYKAKKRSKKEKKEQIAIKIIDALNEAKVGYQVDTDGTMYFYTKDDKEKGNKIIEKIESERV